MAKNRPDRSAPKAGKPKKSAGRSGASGIARGSLRILGGELKGRKVRTVSGPGYRPATAKVREAVFNILFARGMEFPGARVADVFAGSGSLGAEALSRGAASCVFVELDRRAAAAIQASLKDLGLGASRARVLETDAVALTRKPPARSLLPVNFAPLDMAFVDPPYGQDLLAPVLRGLATHDWMAEDGLVLAELEASLDAPAMDGLELLLDRTYGQTRIALWRKEKLA